MPIQFKPISKNMAKFIKAGAEDLYKMQYQGIVKTGTEYDEKEVGPAAWTSKDKTLCLLLFEGDSQAEYALVQQDPESEDVVSDFMGDYGHGIADLVNATAVHFTTSAGGGGGTEITPEGQASIGDMGFYQDSHHYAFTGADPAAMNGDDAQFVTVDGSAMDLRSADRWFAEGIGGSMSGTHIAHLRFKVRARGDAGRTLHAICDQGDRILALGLFGVTDAEWAEYVSPWFDVSALGLDFGYSANGMAYGGISLHAPGGAVDVGDLVLEFTSF